MEIYDKNQIKSNLRQSFGTIVYAIEKIEDASFLRPRLEGKWSPAEIVGHLILSTKPVNKSMSLPKLVLKTQFGTNNRSEKSFSDTKAKYYRVLNKGVQAPPNFTFRGAEEKGKKGLMEMFINELNRLIDNIDNWSEQDLSKYVLPHPAIGKMTIREMLFFTIFHTDHHYKQMQELFITEQEVVPLEE